MLKQHRLSSANTALKSFSADKAADLVDVLAKFGAVRDKALSIALEKLAYDNVAVRTQMTNLEKGLTAKMFDLDLKVSSIGKALTVQIAKFEEKAGIFLVSLINLVLFVMYQ